MAGLGAENRPPDLKPRSVRHPAGIDRILIGIGRLFFLQDLFRGNPFSYKNIPQEIPFRLIARNQAASYGLAVPARRKDQGRIALPEKPRRRHRQLSSVAARYEDHICLLRLILHEDKLRHILHEIHYFLSWLPCPSIPLSRIRSTASSITGTGSTSAMRT